MGINYRISEDTAAMLGCIVECTKLQEHIIEVLTMHYEEKAVYGEIGSPIFEKIQAAKTELYKVLNGMIEENLLTTSTDKEI